jgi:hypothetical protein
MKLSELETEIDLTVDDDSLAPFFKQWINEGLLQLAADHEFPALKLTTPATVSVDNTDWLWPLPDNFHKKLFRCTYMDGSYERTVTVLDRAEDIAYRDHTLQEAYVTSVGVINDGGVPYLGIYPLPTSSQDLKVWYYRKPTVLDDPDDVPDAFPAEYHQRVIIPLVIVRNYQKLLDQVVGIGIQPIQYWKAELTEGLYGAPGQGPGLINYLLKTNRPSRRTGGRDPVGWSPSRYGR